ncbi:MAG: helix-turn-helix domain-containing protein [Propionibacteriaceae bacterium]|jgi:DNA-directed RNA polymerase specialized sigma24 family protein|nr:helix-turn-helix domain-containing protein [Propionibacteriaceae bacterium]
MNKRVTVVAKRWKRGWELWPSTGGVTQSRTLRTARQQVVDYLDTVTPEIDHAGWEIVIQPELGALLDELQSARREQERAQQLQLQASARIRAAVAKLQVAGLSVTDIAEILGVSRGRVSQLVGSGQGAE